jgi:hypothetical protein
MPANTSPAGLSAITRAHCGRWGGRDVPELNWSEYEGVVFSHEHIGQLAIVRSVDKFRWLDRVGFFSLNGL